MRLADICVAHFFSLTMKKYYFIILLAFTCTSIVSCGGDDNGGSGTTPDVTANVNANTSSYAEMNRLEVPHLRGGSSIVLVHKAGGEVNMIIEWDESKMAQRWTAFEMYESNSVKNVSRSDEPFQVDPSIPTQYQTTPWMFTSTSPHFDRGHICASADRLSSSEANVQTFYMSNMQPQYNAFNTGIWLKMENFLRNSWNRYSFRDTLYVVKGGTIDNSGQLLANTSTGLLVPRYFFMAVLCKNSEKTNGGYKAAAFWVEHLNENHSNDSLSGYLISIDRLEELTGIDFFCNLPDYIENTVEANVYPASWGL